jgi:dTDP-4-dehydrorhamnose 3,5-epimerase
LRGLHFQKNEYAQAKLIRVISGEVLDVAVDLRENSPSFGKYFSIILNAENKQQLYIPRGFAHGFVALTDNAITQYKCDNYYNKQAEAGILYNDTDLAINWNLPEKSLKVNARDASFLTLKQYINERETA